MLRSAYALLVAHIRLALQKRTDPDFFAALAKAAAGYDARFSARERVFLFDVARKKVPASDIAKCYPCPAPEAAPLLTVVVFAHKHPAHLPRCLLSLAKQTEKAFDVLIAGSIPLPRHENILRYNAITHMTFTENLTANNAHMLASRHARGENVLFLDSSDVIHPALVRQIFEALRSHNPDMLVCPASAHRPLPQSRVDPPKVRELAFADLANVQGSPLYFSDDEVCHKVFKREPFLRLCESMLTPGPDLWQMLLHTLAFCKKSSCVAMLGGVLIKKTAPGASYELFNAYATGLEDDSSLLYETLREIMEESDAKNIFMHMVFFSIPKRLSELYAIQYGSIELSIIYSKIAFYIDACKNIVGDRLSDLLSVTFAALQYGRFMASPAVHAVHAYRIGQKKMQPKGLCLYENEGLNDIRHHLLSFLREKYPVEYLQKRKFCDYSQLELLYFAITASRSVLILTSFWIHKHACVDRKIIQLWHGGGLMKKILLPAAGSYRQDYVLASSEACRKEYSTIFSVPEDHVLAIGTIQTDKYFDTAAVSEGKKQALAEFPDAVGKRVCFYAPTFRQYHAGEQPSLYCGWDYAGMDRALAGAESLLVFKKHHMLKNIKLNQGVDLCDLHDSPQKWVRETGLEDIFPWICACDIFITDYSSAMFFPLLLNKPVIFYTPDLDDFLSRGNGTLIDYRATVPGPIVTSSAPEALIAAMDEAPSYVGGKKYTEFKNLHVGACDGKARERLLQCIDRLYPEERDKLYSQYAK